jgi:hypothetical protein
MLLAPRSEKRLLELARRVSGDDSLDDVERYRLRPLLGYGLAAIASGCLIVGLVTQIGWFVFGFVGALVVSGFVDRHVTVAAGPSSAFVFVESARRPMVGGDHRRLEPGDVEQISARRWRVGELELWAWGPTRPLLERVAGT